MLTAYEMFCHPPAGVGDPLRPRRAVFLDRDGTLIEDVGYLCEPDQVVLLKGAAEGLRTFQSAGFQIVVVSNQAGLARGHLNQDQVRAVHERFMDVLAQIGVRPSACYYCPYCPDGSVEAYRKTSDGRKPNPGMLLRAAAMLGISLRRSWMIGDKWDDVRAGHAAGTRTVKLPRDSNDPPAGHDPDFFAENLAQAATMIII